MLAFLSALVDPVVALQLTDPSVTYGLVALFLLLAVLIVIRVCVSRARNKRRAQESVTEPLVQAEQTPEEQQSDAVEELPVPEEPTPSAPTKPHMPAAPLPSLSSDEPVLVALRPTDVQEYDGTLYVSFDIDISADETYLV